MAKGFYLSWIDRKSGMADTSDGTISSLRQAATVASNLQQSRGFTRVDVVAVEDEEVLISATWDGLEFHHVPERIREEIIWS